MNKEGRDFSILFFVRLHIIEDTQEHILYTHMEDFELEEGFGSVGEAAEYLIIQKLKEKNTERVIERLVSNFPGSQYVKTRFPRKAKNYGDSDDNSGYHEKLFKLQQDAEKKTWYEKTKGEWERSANLTVDAIYENEDLRRILERNNYIHWKDSKELFKFKQSFNECIKLCGTSASVFRGGFERWNPSDIWITTSPDPFSSLVEESKKEETGLGQLKVLTEGLNKNLGKDISGISLKKVEGSKANLEIHTPRELEVPFKKEQEKAKIENERTVSEGRMNVTVRYSFVNGEEKRVESEAVLQFYANINLPKKFNVGDALPEPDIRVLDVTRSSSREGSVMLSKVYPIKGDPEMWKTMFNDELVDYLRNRKVYKNLDDSEEDQKKTIVAIRDMYNGLRNNYLKKVVEKIDKEGLLLKLVSLVQSRYVERDNNNNAVLQSANYYIVH